MKKLLLVLLLGISLFGFSQEKYQRAKISYSSSDTLEKLEALGIPVDHGIHKKGYYVISEFSTSELEKVQNAGYHVEILIEDAKKHFLKQNKKALKSTRNRTCVTEAVIYPTPANFSFGTMGGYLTYQELLDELDEMKTLFPNLITTKQDIGSFLTEGQPNNNVSPSIGGNGIKWVKISDNPNSAEAEPQILYTALHHAREAATLSQLVFYMWYLLENYDTNPEVKAIVDNTELYFVPVVNPDGYLYNEFTDPNGGGFWRKNRKNGNGTDNNRNYDYFINGNTANGSWGGPGASSNPNSETYHGTGPFSEIENQAIKFFVEEHDFVMAFNNHSFGELLYYPFGYADVPTPEDALFQGVSSELTSRNQYFPLRGSPFAGDSDDFMYGTVGTHNKIYAFTPEIGQSFWPPSSDIIPIANEMMSLNLTAAKMVSNYAVIFDTSPAYTGNQSSNTANFDIKNLGINGNGNFTVRLESVSSNITSVGTPINFNGLQLLEEDNERVSYTLAGGTSSGDDVIYDIVVNNGTYDSKTRVFKKFGSLNSVFEDLANSTSNFNNNGWTTTTSTFVSAPSSITDSNGNYPDNTNETISLSAPIDLTNASGAQVSFYARWEIENNFDYVQFQVSTNGGANWEAQCGNFTNPGSTNGSQPTDEPLYDGAQNAWVQEEIDLSDYLGQSIIVRFQLVSDGGQTADGFYFDDLTFSVLEESVLEVAESFINAFQFYPNPVKDVLTINTQLSNYNISLYNLQGQLVYNSEKNTGTQSIDYSSFSTGLYVLKLTSQETTQTFKIVKK